MADEMTILREAWSEVEPPSPGAQERARALLVADIAQAHAGWSRPRPRRRPTWVWQAGIAAASVAAVLTGVVTAGGSGTSGNDPRLNRPPVAQSAVPAPGIASTFELAAVHAATQPFTAPRPDQWIYVEIKQTLAGQIAGSKGTAAHKTIRSWRRADGLQNADIHNGKLVVYASGPSSEVPPRDYPTLAGLPTDPQGMLAWVRSKTGNDDATAFSVLASMVCLNVLPPDVAAAALRAAALIPGVVETPEPIAIDGRSVTALGRLMDDWRQMDILVDASTHAVVGIRNVAAVDYRDPNGHFSFAKGEFMDMVVLTAALIVDAPGQTS